MSNLTKAEDVELILNWVKTCPQEYYISSMTGEFLHIKIALPFNNQKNEEQTHD
jgi:hypothetical protein|tara:strand:+ start:258 stop:419 length:162 start_codon:yes stop_codon:yes gene_type:complete